MKKITILGGGESGVGAAVLAKSKGLNVFLSDNGLIKDNYKSVLSQYEIEFEEGKHSLDRILCADEVVKSPGIPDQSTLIIDLQKKEIPVISEIEFASRYTRAKLIGVTGSNGKTTTVHLIYHILKNAGLKVGLAGNVESSFALQVAQNDQDIFVLELSSFQLDGMYKCRMDISVILNITPDHLDRYKSFENYADSKFRITQNQTENDLFIYWADDKNILERIHKGGIKAKQIQFSESKMEGEGAYIEKDIINININKQTLTMNIHELPIEGRHNTYNSMAALLIASALQVRKKIIRDSFSDFINVPHRLEFVAYIHGIRFINDSKATNINSAWYALECMTKPVVWIAGGYDKGNDYNELKALARQKVKALVCMGTDNTKLVEFFKGIIPVIIETDSMDQAVNYAYQLGKTGDAVLLSPACASYDLFQNYKERGDKFKKAVKSL